MKETWHMLLCLTKPEKVGVSYSDLKIPTSGSWCASSDLIVEALTQEIPLRCREGVLSGVHSL